MGKQTEATQSVTAMLPLPLVGQLRRIKARTRIPLSALITIAVEQLLSNPPSFLDSSYPEKHNGVQFEKAETR